MSFNIDRLLPSAEVGFCKNLGNELVEGWLEGERDHPSPVVSDEDYYVYGDNQEAFNFRPEYLLNCLKISDIGDAAVILLNPAIIDDNHEWEAWFFDAKLPGVKRYQSFRELMEVQLKDARYLQAELDKENQMPRPSIGTSSETSST